jgi:hypothetical protein
MSDQLPPSSSTPLIIQSSDTNIQNSTEKQQQQQQQQQQSLTSQSNTFRVNELDALMGLDRLSSDSIPNLIGTASSFLNRPFTLCGGSGDFLRGSLPSMTSLCAAIDGKQDLTFDSFEKLQPASQRPHKSDSPSPESVQLVASLSDSSLSFNSKEKKRTFSNFPTERPSISDLSKDQSMMSSDEKFEKRCENCGTFITSLSSWNKHRNACDKLFGKRSSSSNPSVQSSSSVNLGPRSSSSLLLTESQQRLFDDDLTSSKVCLFPYLLSIFTDSLTDLI